MAVSTIIEVAWGHAIGAHSKCPTGAAIASRATPSVTGITREDEPAIVVVAHPGSRNE